MPVYNRSAYVADAIESILTQTYKQFELLIVDDHSTDNSWSIIKNYQKHYPLLIKPLPPQTPISHYPWLSSQYHQSCRHSHW